MPAGYARYVEAARKRAKERRQTVLDPLYSGGLTPSERAARSRVFGTPTELAEARSEATARRSGYQHSRYLELLGKGQAGSLIDLFRAAGYGRVGQELLSASQARRRGFGQLDISTLSPGMLAVIRQTRSERRRRSRRGAGIAAFGGASAGRKTLLGE